ncbi:MAG: Uma2 family endonuclease [Myxococcota bacterium]
MTEGARIMSYAEYLAFEEAAGTKHEYVNGAVVAMAGGTIEHGRLAANLTLMIGQLARAAGCSVYFSDVRVRVMATNRTTYPDLTVVCGPVIPAGDDPHAITNPTLLVEVLSPSTEASDRGEKWAHYQRLPSLRAYLLVAQDPARVELFARDASGEVWTFQQAGRGQSLQLDALGGSLDVDAVFAGP